MVNFCLFAQPVNPLKRRLPLSTMEINCPEKKIKELAEKFETSAKIQRPKVCVRCLNGESGHITHHLEPLPMDIDWPVNK